MIKVKKGDLVYQIDEKDLEQYLASGYSLLVESNIKKKPCTSKAEANNICKSVLQKKYEVKND